MKKLAFCSLILAFTAACSSTPAAQTEVQMETAEPLPTTISPVPTNPTVPSPPPHCRQSILEPTEIIRAIHIGGNDGINYEPTVTFPEEYFEYLHELNVNWVGIGVSLHYEDSMDSTIERVYSGIAVPTYSDDFLRMMIRKFHAEGFCFYISMALESSEAEIADHPVARYQLGEQTAPLYYEELDPEFWPWILDHPEHESFVTEFWETYTENAVHFGKLAEEEGVALFSIGTETDGLFRTRPSDNWPNDFGDELRKMVASVREVYSGALSYDMLYSVFTEPQTYLPGSEHMWKDLDFDVIGLSGYFPLAKCPPRTPFPFETLEESWERIFQEYLIPLQAANPGRPIYFTEFGYTDTLDSVINASANMFTPIIIQDRNFNGLDDGQEMQVNIHQALYNVMDRYPGVVNGVFQWDMGIATDELWAEWFLSLRGLAVRGKLAEDVVRTFYGGEPRSIIPTAIPVPSDRPAEPQGLTCVVYEDELSSVWTMDPWGGSVDLSSAAEVFGGSNAIELSLNPGGAITLDNISIMDTTQFSHLIFYINGGEDGNQMLYIEMKSRDNIVLGERISLGDGIIEDYPLQPHQWHKVIIPLTDLNPDGVVFGWFDIGDTSGNGAAPFFIDDIHFLDAAP